MRVTVNCFDCHEPQELEVPEAAWHRYQSDKLIGVRQSVLSYFPEMPAAERELFISGMCGKCWDSLFADAAEADETIPADELEAHADALRKREEA